MIPWLLAAVMAAGPSHAASTAAPPAARPGPTAAATERSYTEEKITVPLFGQVSVYRPEPVRQARGVILFISGDGGWNKGVVDMARRVAPRALVVGLSMPAWQKIVEKHAGTCWFPAGELESTAQAIEKLYKLPQYVKPILLGYSSGATVVYAALAQAPADSFAGAISLGFCPDVEVARSVCGHADWKPSYDAKKRTSLLPVRPDLAPRLDGVARWTALQGDVDQVCDPPSVGRFVAQIPAARVIPLPKVGHGFSAPRNWGQAFDDAVETLLQRTSVWEQVTSEERHATAQQSPEEIRRRLAPLGLPLEVVWPEGATDAIIFVSGDGGWAELDQQVSASLAARGVGVVGWNALRYFWSAKTPTQFGEDLMRVIGALPAEVRIFLGGYSFGAETVPVCLARVAAAGAARPEGVSRVTGLVLIAPGRYATFEVSPLDWIRTSETPTAHSVREAIAAVGGLPVLCLESSQSSGSDDSGCPMEPLTGLAHVVLPGGHHFAGDFEALAARTFDFIRSCAPAASGNTGASREVLTPIAK